MYDWKVIWKAFMHDATIGMRLETEEPINELSFGTILSIWLYAAMALMVLGIVMIKSIGKKRFDTGFRILTQVWNKPRDRHLNLVE